MIALCTDNWDNQASMIEEDAVRRLADAFDRYKDESDPAYDIIWALDVITKHPDGREQLQDQDSLSQAINDSWSDLTGKARQHANNVLQCFN